MDMRVYGNVGESYSCIAIKLCGGHKDKVRYALINHDLCTKI